MRKSKSSRRTFYYISGLDEKGQMAFDGAYNSEEEARDKGLQLFRNGNFRIHGYRTSDKSAAKSMWRHEYSLEVGISNGMIPLRNLKTQ